MHFPQENATEEKLFTQRRLHFLALADPIFLQKLPSHTQPFFFKLH